MVKAAIKTSFSTTYDVKNFNEKDINKFDQLST